jgi:CMP-N,N'-diacetyllegionaminic acid synthase
MINGKTVVAIIPARGGSKGVPRKNLRHFQNKSLLAHSIHVAKQSQFIDRVVVSSDNDEIIAEALQAGADVPFVRPAELATDTSPAYEAMIHALTNLPQYDYVVLLQVTTPLRDVSDIDGCIEFCIRQQAPACVTIAESPVNPYWIYSLNDSNSLVKVIPGEVPLRRQDSPLAYVLNGAVYIAKSDWYLKRKTFLTDETIGYVMSASKSLDIDTEFDFELLELHARANSQEPQYAADE